MISPVSISSGFKFPNSSAITFFFKSSIIKFLAPFISASSSSTFPVAIEAKRAICFNSSTMIFFSPVDSSTFFSNSLFLSSNIYIIFITVFLLLISNPNCSKSTNILYSNVLPPLQFSLILLITCSNNFSTSPLNISFISLILGISSGIFSILSDFSFLQLSILSNILSKLKSNFFLDMNNNSPFFLSLLFPAVGRPSTSSPASSSASISRNSSSLLNSSISSQLLS